MSSRSNRRRKPGDMFPGMPDLTAKKPPKASDSSWQARTLDEAIARTNQLVDEAIARYTTDKHEIVGVYLLYSGGSDSIVPAHLLRDHIDGFIHVNTGTAIRQTTEHVREVAEAWGAPLHELRPRASYRDLVLGRVLVTRGETVGQPAWIGFPGPGGDSHRVMYRRLKDEPLQRFRRDKVGRFGRRKKILYIAGMRWDESDPRFRNAEEIDPDGAIIWVSAVVHWTNAHMQEYRARYRCQQDHDHAKHRMCDPDALPVNEVTEHLHMSGDCTCGAFAKPGELDEIRFFYPEKAAEIEDLEGAAAAAGIPACKWGQRPPGTGRQPKGSKSDDVMPRLCAGCKPPIPGQNDLVDHWLTRGLITPEQHAEFDRSA